MLNYRYKACELGIEEQVVEMFINGSGIPDTARALKINKDTAISILKKSGSLIQVNPNFQALNSEGDLDVRLELACE